MNGLAILSRMVAFGLAIAGLQGFLGPNVRECSTAKAADRESVSAAKADFAVIASSDSSSRSILPTGWRRTTRGWERAETWGSDSLALAIGPADAQYFRSRFAAVGGTQPQTVGQWMLWDQAREPVWANSLMGSVKRVHPLFVAVFLIAVAVLITRLSEPSGKALVSNAKSGSVPSAALEPN